MVRTVSKRCKEEDHRTYGSLSDDIDEETVEVVDKNAAFDEEKYCNSAYDSLIARKASQQSSTTSAAVSRKRENVVNELLHTEEGYIRHIRTLVQSYIPALRLHITPEEEASVFLNINQIYTLHVNFYRELSAGTSDGSGYKCKVDVSAFTRYKERFLVYSYYCAHLDESQNLIDQLMRKPAFQSTVEELNKKLDRRVKLKDQLIVCFQRVLKYKLLLCELLKNTPNDLDEHDAVETAHVAMEDVAMYINEYKRDTEAVAEIEHIQVRIMDTCNAKKRYTGLNYFIKNA